MNWNDQSKKILERRSYYKNLTETDPSSRLRVLQSCENDIVFWIQNFCWCFEPRKQSEFPMVLFPFQSWALKDWVHHIDHPPPVKEDRDLVIEKCRDMGVTWCFLYLFAYYWLFRPNSEFLISSFREQEVDYQDSMATLFPKLRFIINKLPDWMKPKGYNPKLHSPHMKIYNPENNSIIRGSAPVPNYGRSGRYLAVLFDELPQWAYPRASWDACSQSTEIRIALGTPYGRDNIYAELALDPNNVRMIYPGSVA